MPKLFWEACSDWKWLSGCCIQAYSEVYENSFHASKRGGGKKKFFTVNRQYAPSTNYLQDIYLPPNFGLRVLIGWYNSETRIMKYKGWIPVKYGSVFYHSSSLFGNHRIEQLILLFMCESCEFMVNYFSIVACNRTGRKENVFLFCSPADKQVIAQGQGVKTTQMI